MSAGETRREDRWPRPLTYACPTLAALLEDPQRTASRVTATLPPLACAERGAVSPVSCSVHAGTVASEPRPVTWKPSKP